MFSQIDEITRLFHHQLFSFIFLSEVSDIENNRVHANTSKDRRFDFPRWITQMRRILNRTTVLTDRVFDGKPRNFNVRLLWTMRLNESTGAIPQTLLQLMISVRFRALVDFWLWQIELCVFLVGFLHFFTLASVGMLQFDTFAISSSSRPVWRRSVSPQMFFKRATHTKQIYCYTNPNFF